MYNFNYKQSDKHIRLRKRCLSVSKKTKNVFIKIHQFMRELSFVSIEVSVTFYLLRQE